MIVVYGLKNCETCKKALTWLKSEGLEHRFHDIRADGLDGDALAAWLEELGHEVLVNTRGTTWRYRIPTRPISTTARRTP
ncbi:MAG: glutaredoxin domain-containing protein [Alphaproteobacteria bacterium]